MYATPAATIWCSLCYKEEPSKGGFASPHVLPELID